jgi:hypothetical protein
MNGGPNVFGSGNRANATIGRAVRLIMLNVGGDWPPDFDKSTLGHPGKYTYCVAENELDNPFAPYHVEHGYSPMDSTVFAIAAKPLIALPTTNATTRRAFWIRCGRR